MAFRKKFYPSARQRSSCLGRVGAVVNDVLQTFNDDTQKQLNQNDIVRWFNMAQLVIAQRGYWKKSGLVALVSGQKAYNLNVLFDDYVEFASCRYVAETDTSGYNDRMVPISDWRSYKSWEASGKTSDRPFGYYLDSDNLYLWPAPNKTTVSSVGGTGGTSIAGVMDYPVQALLPTIGHPPGNGTDVNGNTYTEWELSDEAGFTFTLPSTYVVGEDLVLTLIESSASSSKAHKWSIVVTANTAFDETYTAEYTSSATGGTVSTRTISISTSASVGTYPLAAGTLVSVEMSRVAADSNEDSANIRLYTLKVTSVMTTSPSPVVLDRAVEVRYDYCPADLQCTTSYTFFTPKPYDGMYRDFALYNAYLTESDSVNVVGEEAAPSTNSSYGQYKHGFYLSSFNKQMDRLFANSNTPGMRLRGYR